MSTSEKRVELLDSLGLLKDGMNALYYLAVCRDSLETEHAITENEIENAIDWIYAKLMNDTKTLIGNI